MQDAGVSPLVRSQAAILQLNIGLYCNQACTHCHVESSPKRTEMMDRATAERCIELLKASPSITTLDITGGAPELNSEFRYLVEAASELDVEIIDRCNLTVLVEPGQEYLAQFLADHKVWHQLISPPSPLLHRHHRPNVTIPGLEVHYDCTSCRACIQGCFTRALRKLCFRNMLVGCTSGSQALRRRSMAPNNSHIPISHSTVHSFTGAQADWCVHTRVGLGQPLHPRSCER